MFFSVHWPLRLPTHVTVLFEAIKDFEIKSCNYALKKRKKKEIIVK